MSIGQHSGTDFDVDCTFNLHVDMFTDPSYTHTCSSYTRTWKEHCTVDWVAPFYTQKTLWHRAAGKPEGILAHDQQRTATLERLCGPDAKAILELGCGDGGTAAALVDLGHEVIGIELSALRAHTANKLAQTPRKGSLTIIEGDFYSVELNQTFDVVCYWDGFGVGTDGRTNPRYSTGRNSTATLSCLITDDARSSSVV